ncbi:MAG: hypothetical protein AAFX06_29290 [Planctomycetota bacterium]
MYLTLYNHSERGALEPRDVQGEYQHTRGGSAMESWLRNESLPLPFDLLFTLDLADPSVDLQIPGIKRLPLLYGMNYVEYSGDQSYRVTAEGTATILGSKNLTPNQGEPLIEAVAEAPVDFVDVGLDLSKAEDALKMLQVFGLGDLDESELQRALDIAYGDDYNLDVLEDWIVYRESTKQEYLEFWGSQPFWQPGGASDTCDTPDCPSGTHDSSVRVIAQCQVESLLVIFRYCNVCHTVFTLNQA